MFYFDSFKCNQNIAISLKNAEEVKSGSGLFSIDLEKMNIFFDKKISYI